MENGFLKTLKFKEYVRTVSVLPFPPHKVNQKVLVSDLVIFNGL